MPERLPLRVVVEEAWAMLDTAARQAGIEVIDEVPPGDALVVRADRRRLKQIVRLPWLSNAIKYNRPGGWVRLRAQSRGRRGGTERGRQRPGPEPRPKRARLFTPFERLGAQHGPVAGTGLGLALSRQLAEAMGGTIEVDSTPGQGCHLPRAPAGRLMRREPARRSAPSAGSAALELEDGHAGQQVRPAAHRLALLDAERVEDGQSVLARQHLEVGVGADAMFGVSYHS